MRGFCVGVFHLKTDHPFHQHKKHLPTLRNGLIISCFWGRFSISEIPGFSTRCVISQKKIITLLWGFYTRHQWNIDDQHEKELTSTKWIPFRAGFAKLSPTTSTKRKPARKGILFVLVFDFLTHEQHEKESRAARKGFTSSTKRKAAQHLFRVENSTDSSFNCVSLRWHISATVELMKSTGNKCWKVQVSMRDFPIS